jgi:hypothetical protein
MRRLAGIVVVIALASAGCIGSSGSSSPAPSTGHPGPAPQPPLTYLTINYPVATCPPGSSCIKTSQDYYLVRRHLTCSPDGGDYQDPGAVCRALTHIATKLDAGASGHCLCADNPGPLAKAVGIFHGKRRTIPLDGCSLCGLQGIGGDLKLLASGM